MGVPFWGWALFFWIVIAILGGIYDGQIVDPAGESSLNDVLQMRIFRTSQVGAFGADFTMPLPNMSFFTAIANLASLNSGIFAGNLNMARWFLLAVFAGPVMYILIRDVLPTILNSISTLRGLFRI